MARPILGLQGSKVKPDLLQAVRPGSRVGTLTGVALEKRLRESRSPRYLRAMAQLDAGGHGLDPRQIQSLIEAIREELPEIAIEQLPVGIVSKCYLGAPFEVHSLDLDGNILQHFRGAEPMPPLMERARSLALHGAYMLVEVYKDCLRGIGADGTVCVTPI